MFITHGWVVDLFLVGVLAVLAAMYIWGTVIPAIAMRLPTRR